MQSDIKARIGKMIYHLSTENRAAANAELQEIMKQKVNAIYNAEYAKVRAAVSQESK